MTGSLIDEVALAAAREHEILDYYGVIAPGGGVAAAAFAAALRCRVDGGWGYPALLWLRVFNMLLLVW